MQNECFGYTDDQLHNKPKTLVNFYLDFFIIEFKQKLKYAGMFQYILQFMNVAGIVSNGFIIAFTSQWANQNLQSQESRITCVVIFEVKNF